MDSPQGSKKSGQGEPTQKTKMAADQKTKGYGPKKTKLHKEAKICFSLPSTKKVDLYYFAKVWTETPWAKGLRNKNNRVVFKGWGAM